MSSRTSIVGRVRAANGSLVAVARRMAGQQLQQLCRPFASTSQRSANIPQFAPASSPELQALIDKIKTEVILPSFLPYAQHKKLHQAKWRTLLQTDPITMEIDGEIFKFRYRNPLTDLPNTYKCLIDALSRFEKPADFGNLKPLLEGVAHAGRKLPPRFYTHAARLMARKGRIGEIIDCARGVRDTGFVLNTTDTVDFLLNAVQLKALDADWDEAETRRALRWAEMVVEMLEDKSHWPVSGKPLARDPLVLAAPLHLAAVLAARHDAGEEMVAKVNKLARDLVAVWPEDKTLMEAQPHDRVLAPNIFIHLATPLLHGLDTALKIVEPQLAAQLQTRRDTLALDVKEALPAAAARFEGQREAMRLNIKDARDKLAVEADGKPGPPPPNVQKMEWKLETMQLENTGWHRLYNRFYGA